MWVLCVCVWKILTFQYNTNNDVFVRPIDYKYLDACISCQSAATNALALRNYVPQWSVSACQYCPLDDPTPQPRLGFTRSLSLSLSSVVCVCVCVCFMVGMCLFVLLYCVVINCSVYIVLCLMYFGVFLNKIPFLITVLCVPLVQSVLGPQTRIVVFLI